MPARRGQLIATAAVVFAEHGFKGTTTRQLAQAAGVTEAVIFQHFPDKEALYAAVLAQKSEDADTDEWLDEIERRHAARDDAGVLEVLYSRLLDLHERDASLLRLMVYSALEHHALARRMQDGQSMRFYKVIERFITDRQAAGAFRPGPPSVLVRAILALPVYHVMQRRLFRQPWPAVERDTLVEFGVQFALAGLAAPARARKRTPRRDVPTLSASRSGRR